mmetsp:Transcript_23356/g.65159  ORF Transcript_23356/g.65159 Transcript_23356/m.65159 type:complete len:143 (+) Transcript_23356:145-573(+)
MPADDYEYVSYKGPRTIVAETVYCFLRGSLYGAAFGLVTPFHAPGSPGALKELQTGRFTPAPVFGSLRSVPSNAIVFGSLLASQRFGSKTCEWMRGQQDWWNEAAGCLVAYPYYQFCLVRNLRTHNRVVGTILACSLVYANL